MPKLSKSLPKYQKHRASGQAVVTLNGRDHYLGPHGTKASKREYDRLIAEYLSSGRSASFGAPKSDVSVVELAADYVRHAKSYYGTARTSEYFRILRVIRPVKTLYRRSLAVEFGPLQFKAVRRGHVITPAANCSRFRAKQNGESNGTLESELTETAARDLGTVSRAATQLGGPRFNAGVGPNSMPMSTGLRKGKTEARETDPVLAVKDAVVDATLPHLPDVVADMVLPAANRGPAA